MYMSTQRPLPKVVYWKTHKLHTPSKTKTRILGENLALVFFGSQIGIATSATATRKARDTPAEVADDPTGGGVVSFFSTAATGETGTYTSPLAKSTFSLPLFIYP
mmetsp:Transcript_1421/g.2619  ORF Transcript_1421/g.2619 Transcript_1421/m.2619 type:complete len:105 (-) Transcript_1421:1976-2290(-)